MRRYFKFLLNNWSITEIGYHRKISKISQLATRFFCPSVGNFDIGQCLDKHYWIIVNKVSLESSWQVSFQGAISGKNPRNEPKYNGNK